MKPTPIKHLEHLIQPNTVCVSFSGYTFSPHQNNIINMIFTGSGFIILIIKHSYVEGYTSSLYMKNLKFNRILLWGTLLSWNIRSGPHLLICEADYIKQTREEVLAAVRGNAPTPAPPDICLKTPNDLLRIPEIHLNRSALENKRATSVMNFSDIAVGKQHCTGIKEQRYFSAF